MAVQIMVLLNCNIVRECHTKRWCNTISDMKLDIKTGCPVRKLKKLLFWPVLACLRLKIAVLVFTDEDL